MYLKGSVAERRRTEGERERERGREGKREERMSICSLDSHSYCSWADARS